MPCLGSLYLILLEDMITELPNSEDYKSLGREWLIQSFGIVYDYAEELEYLEDWKESDWHFHKGKLSTALILLHQATESILKAEIIKISPYLLLDIPSKNWPTLPRSPNKSFNELFTINSESLLRIFCATCRIEQNKENLVKTFEEVRVKRNQIVHGLHKEILRPEYLVKLQFETAIEFFKNDLWNLIKTEERSHPLYNELDNEVLITELYHKLLFIKNHLTQKKYNELLKIKGRGYLCPECSSISQDWDLKSVYLSPNRPTSKNGICIICDTKFELKREDCSIDECKGNVLLQDLERITCLTCLEEEEVA